MDAKQLRQIIKEELEPIKMDLEGIHVGLQTLDKEIKELSENVDAARGDIELLHMDVKGIRDKEGLFHSRNKREIDEIKTHLNIPLLSDIPET